MPGKKLTDNEIIKIFDCCYADKPCEQCPCYVNYKCVLPCDETNLIPQKIVDLINHLQADNGKLQDSVDRYSVQVANQREQIEKYQPIKETLCVLWETMLNIGVSKGKDKPTLEELAEAVQEIKTEAYKEFAEKLKVLSTNKFWNGSEMHELKVPFVGVDDIDNLLKELVGENNASEV